jgi:hypothetical protein
MLDAATLCRSTLVACVLLGCGEDPLPATGVLLVETFESAIVDDEYVLRVRLPPGYDDDPTAAYPLVIQLDPTYAGLEEYDITVGLISQHAAAGEWPETIVVGVDYHDPYLRDRDYVPSLPPDPEFAGDGADRFYRVLRDEILPHIESEYRIDAEQRVLVGHSKGAVFAWYATFRHAPPEPPMFHAVVAADAGLDEYLFTYERWHAERSTSLPIRLYASRAVYNGAGQQIAFDAMIERLGDHDFVGLEFVSESLETDHGGAIVPSFEAGLAHALLGGQP